MPDGNGVTRSEIDGGFLIEGDGLFIVVARDADSGARYHATWGETPTGRIHYAESYVMFDEENGGREQGTFVSVGTSEGLVHLTSVERDPAENTMDVINYGTQVMNIVSISGGGVYHFNNNDLTGFG